MPCLNVQVHAECVGATSMLKSSQALDIDGLLILFDVGVDISNEWGLQAYKHTSWAATVHTASRYSNSSLPAAKNEYLWGPFPALQNRAVDIKWSIQCSACRTLVKPLPLILVARCIESWYIRIKFPPNMQTNKQISMHATCVDVLCRRCQIPFNIPNHFLHRLCFAWECWTRDGCKNCPLGLVRLEA